MFFVQVNTAGILFNLKATCGGGDSFLIFNHLKIKFINLAAAGGAIDWPEGDSKKDSPIFGGNFQEALAVFGTAQQKKIIAWLLGGALFFFVGAVVAT